MVGGGFFRVGDGVKRGHGMELGTAGMLLWYECYGHEGRVICAFWSLLLFVFFFFIKGWFGGREGVWLAWKGLVGMGGLGVDGGEGKGL